MTLLASASVEFAQYRCCLTPSLTSYADISFPLALHFLKHVAPGMVELDIRGNIAIVPGCCSSPSPMMHPFRRSSGISWITVLGAGGGAVLLVTLVMALSWLSSGAEGLTRTIAHWLAP